MDTPVSKKSNKSLFIIAGGLFAIIATAVAAYVYYNQNSPMQAIAKQITSFKVYYFKDAIPGDFSLVKNSVHYQNGVLVFSMKNPASKTLIFTEQALPSSFDTASLQGDKDFKTAYGQGYVTDGQSRTTGALLTDDKTWLLVNAPSPVGGSIMQQVINSLEPTKN